MKFFRSILEFGKDIYRNKFVIYQLTKRDYKNRYVGSTLGFVWTIIQPLVMILVLWFVFVEAFKNRSINGKIPFIAWLCVGIVPWYFFSEAFSACTSVFQEYSYLVKKINFKVAILPIVKLMSSFITHMIFIVITVGILLFSGLSFSWWWFQVLYYVVAMLVFLLGLCWIFSSLQVFVRDMAQVVTVLLSFGFWLTPIFWDFNLLPEKYRFFFKLNPMFYIIDGYKKSFVFHQPFWVDLEWTIYFWVTTLIILLIGVLLFRRLRPHFADVL